MNKPSIFGLVSFLCVIYVFMGIAPWCYFLFNGKHTNIVVGLAFFALWVGNFFLLAYSNKQW